MASNITVRKAVREDMQDVSDMIQELAVFEKMGDEPKLTVEDLVRDGGFASDTAHPLFHCFVAEEVKEATATTPETRKLVGYGMCFTGYSTWAGKALLMKDLFVADGYRSCGIGRKILTEIARFALIHNYARLDWHVLYWNTPAVKFYDRLGATDLTQKEEWLLYRLPLNKQ